MTTIDETAEMLERQQASARIATCDCSEYDQAAEAPASTEPLCDDCGRWDSHMVRGRCEQCRAMRPAVSLGIK